MTYISQRENFKFCFNTNLYYICYIVEKKYSLLPNEIVKYLLTTPIISIKIKIILNEIL